MLFRRQAEQLMKHKQQKKSHKGKEMRWWDLALIGTGAVIGAGFFLGTALSIHLAGPSLLLLYLLGGLTAFLVFNSLADMSLHDPQPGSFRVYARKAFGPSVGFISGWMYWLAGILIMSSEVAALSIFTRYWFPGIPLFVFAAFYSLLALSINLKGVRDFGRIESLFGLVKTSSLLIFIIFGLFYVTGLINPLPYTGPQTLPLIASRWLPNGLLGVWPAMIFVLFSYGGIEIMGIMATELKNPKEVGRSGRVMLAALTLIYSAALLLALLMVPLDRISVAESPFVSALSIFNFGFIDSLLNLLIISAAFSTMVGALFAVTNVIVSLAEDGDAPRYLIGRNRRGVALPALSLSGLGLGGAVLLSFLLPNAFYEYLTTAAGVMLIMNWIIILSSQIKNNSFYTKQNLKERYQVPGYPYSSYGAMAVIFATIIGATLMPLQRTGVFVSLAFVLLIAVASKLRFLKAKSGWGALVPLRKRLDKNKDPQ